MSESLQSNPLPLFYDCIRMLNRMADQELRLTPARDFSFASGTNAIPLVAEEFFTAQSCYPIVFAGDEKPRPVAIVGLRNGDNLFIGPDGMWDPAAYLPLYVRRHPFLLIDATDGRSHLGIDPEAPRWSQDEGITMFEDGEPTGLTKNMLEFCTRFRRQHELAMAFAAALKEHAMLVEYRFTVTAAERRHYVSGCQVVAEDKLAALPDEVFLEWRRAGWLPMITAHLLSLRQWEALGRRSAARTETMPLAA